MSDPLNLKSNQQYQMPSQQQSYIIPKAHPNSYPELTTAQSTYQYQYPSQLSIQPTFGIKSRQQESVGSLLAFPEPQAEIPRQTLFNQREVRNGVTPNAVSLSRINQKIASHEQAIAKQEQVIEQMRQTFQTCTENEKVVQNIAPDQMRETKATFDDVYCKRIQSNLNLQQEQA